MMRLAQQAAHVPRTAAQVATEAAAVIKVVAAEPHEAASPAVRVALAAAAVVQQVAGDPVPTHEAVEEANMRRPGHKRPPSVARLK
jgi:hypothetical protein